MLVRKASGPSQKHPRLRLSLSRLPGEGIEGPGDRKALMGPLRIASFLPAATEMVFALGLGDRLVGVSHECDYPPQAKEKPVVVRCAMDLASLDLKQIDETVRKRVGQGGSVYAVDEVAIRQLSPTLIITQDLCQVCAPSGNEATQVLRALSPEPEFLWQTPHSFQDVLNDTQALGERTGTADRAQALVREMRQRVQAVQRATSDLPPVKVFFMEWLDPVFCGGHWVPEMIEWAGGRDEIAKAGMDSVRITWEKVLEWDPEVLVVSPCGFNARQALEQARLLTDRKGWQELKAVQDKRVFAVDANSYFAKPGPRLADGVELLGHLFHPFSVPWTGPAEAFFPLL